MKKILILILLLAALLRFWQLDKVPVSLFGDEIDVGYQAYSILKTGRDYMGNFLPIHFQSLAEHRTPLYLYSAVPTVALFGVSSWGVRLPAAIFGALGILAIYLLVKEITKNEKLGLLSAFLLSITPWHIHFSRAGFEVTQMLFLYMMGIYYLLTGLRGKNTLWLSAIFFVLTPFAYNTAKLFLPLTILAIIIIWRDTLIKIPRIRIILAVIAFSIIAIPFAISTLFGGGSERIGGISIFSDPTVVPQIGFDRVNDANVRGSNQSATLIDKLFHNKVTVYSGIFTSNYLESFSTQFLFTKGDSLNLRQSSGTEFYRFEFIFMIIGLIFLATSNLDKKIKAFLIFWLLASPIPSSLTQGGGGHATRLILMLPILVILTAFGIYYVYIKIDQKFRKLFVVLVSASLLVGFIFYQHNYWVHYPLSSERWWHAGYEQAIKSAVEEGKNYDKVIISGGDEPPLIFFLAWSEYPPDKFQKSYPLAKVDLEGFGQVSKLDKYYFPPINNMQLGQGKSLYDLGRVLQKDSLYLAPEKQMGFDLIKEPGRTPPDLRLVKAIKYPFDGAAFYLFTKK